MKIAAYSIPEIKPGKYSIKDSRLDQVDKLVKAKKKTYLQVELINPENILEADVIVAPQDSCADLILKDLEFVEIRLSRQPEEEEKTLLNKLKAILEKEEFIFKAGLAQEEKKLLSACGLLTIKPVIMAVKDEQEDVNSLLAKALREGGYISFFTAGEKDTRAWLLKKGATAWEAAGEIHSDIQRGFIRAEIISFADYIACGGETQAKQADKLRLEQKDYPMQDCDLANFRFNK